MTNADNIQIITTGDGSSSLLIPALGETYHSRHGALRESLHVFIDNGLRHVMKNRDRISILEIGFGTGLNAWLTCNVLHGSSKHAIYTSLETNPLAESLTTALNYTHGSSLAESEFFNQIHRESWNEMRMIHQGFTLCKMHVSLQEFTTDSYFDLVYYDAFGPPTQPEMWTELLFRKIFERCSPGAVLVTYCAKGQVRRDMESAGWTIERLPGPPGKREMLRGTKLI